MATTDPSWDGVKATQWVKYALTLCSGCPAQYDCARYAVIYEMRAGTWAMRIKVLRWLQDQDTALAIIAAAEAAGAPLKDVVAEMKKADEANA